jgi:hypothetical protein
MTIYGFDSLIFFDGVAFDDGVLAFAAFPNRPGRPRKASGTRILWFDAGTWTDGGYLPLAGVGIATLAADRRTLVVLGRDGDVAVAGQDRTTMESLPGAIGPLRGVRNLGGFILAYGMNRQIFRRMPEGGWVRWDTGMPVPQYSNDMPVSERLKVGMSMIGGINAVATDAAGRCCAVGFRGEIYEWEAGQWQPVDSPTNLILQDICPAECTGLYACGQSGTILHSATAHAWRLVEHDAPSAANFTSVRMFRNKLFLADGRSLRALTGDQCELQAMGVTDGYPSSSRLFATQDVLLSVAGREVYRTFDARMWEPILQ